MKVACLQLKPAFGERDENLNKARRAILEASRQDVRLAVLPELYTSGYIMEDRAEALRLAEPVPGGDTVRAYEDMARESGCAIVAGLPERDGDRVYNSCVVVTPEGYLGAYRKIHLFFKETEWFDAGIGSFPRPRGAWRFRGRRCSSTRRISSCASVRTR
jgi:N-carbamoylputrescine amidase